jgi:hypothetical protein
MMRKTLADVRDLVEKHLAAQYRHKPTWRHVSIEIAKAAEGEKDLLEICVSPLLPAPSALIPTNAIS